jgi:hypothetical protein
MLSNSILHLGLWIEALNTVAHRINRVPSKSIPKTPYELWIGRKPSINYLHIWGCPIEAKIFNTTRKMIYCNTCRQFFVSANNYSRYKNDLLFFVSAVRDNRYLKLILGIGFLYQPLLPKIFRSRHDASQKYLHPPAHPYLHTARPSSSTRSKISLSTPPALPLSIAPGQGWRRGATLGIDQP